MPESTKPAAASPPKPPGLSFSSFGLNDAILRGVIEAGFTEASPIQGQAIPVVMAGRDLVALAQTGTGKTAAFGLPAMSRIDTTKKGVALLVITPTRELATQVSEQLFKLGRHAGIRAVAITGGESSWRQLDGVAKGAQVVVATPGRLRDLLESGRLVKFAPSIVVLDEADEMLDMGFMEDIEAIFSKLPPTPRQTLLFSATMPPPIARLAERVLKDPVRIDLTTGVRYAKDVEQRFAVIEDHERADAVARLIDGEEPEKAIIFCRTKIETDNLANVLAGRGILARALHGDIEQSERQRVLRAFRAGTTDVLVATDVAARGLDIADVSHVINYHLPFDQDAYVHAITLVTAYEFHGLRRIQQAIKATFIPSEIPSLRDVRKRVGSRVLAEAMKQPISEEAVELFAALCSEVDVTEAACHLLSMLLAGKEVKGPERIGMRAEQAKKLAEGQGGGGGNRPRYGSGGGGGYRGRGAPPPRRPRY